VKTGDSVRRAFVLGVEAMRQEAMRTLAEDCEAAAPTRVWTAAIQAAIEAIRDAKVLPPEAFTRAPNATVKSR